MLPKRCKLVISKNIHNINADIAKYCELSNKDPRKVTLIAADTYKFQPEAIPWEKEAFWAAKTEGMTMNALQACARGSMWTEYEPTPLTRLWLERNGYVKGG